MRTPNKLSSATKAFIVLLLFISAIDASSQVTNIYENLVEICPTKTLYEKGHNSIFGIRGVDLKGHNGYTDDSNSTDHYIYEHIELVNSCVPSIAPAISAYDDFRDSIDINTWGFLPGNTNPSQLTDPTDVDGVLLISDWDYNSLNLSVFDSGWVYLDPIDSTLHLRFHDYQALDTVIVDTANFYSTFPRDTSTYNIDTVDIAIDSSEVFNAAFNNERYFALALSECVYYDESTQPKLKFLLPDYFLNKRPDRDLFIDFGNGQPPVQVSSGQVYDVTYPSVGTYWVRLLDDESCIPSEMSCFQSSFKIHIAHKTNPDNIIIVDPLTVLNPCNLDYSLDSSLTEFGGSCSFGSAKVSTWLRKDNPDPQNRITRPVIVLDGFNSFGIEDMIHDKPRLGGGYGLINPNSIRSGVFPDFKPHQALERFPLFIDSILNADYDFVFVDWYTNRTSVQANANAFKEILQQINAQMQAAGSSEEIIVIGPSMGGQISKIAMRQMELSGCCHNVRLYVSFDSPHLGANIALSLQHFVKSLFTRFDYPINGESIPSATLAKQRYEWVINSPAARQILVEQVEGNEPFHSYMQFIDSIGYPKIPELIAITNGSYSGIMQGDREYPDDTDNSKVASTQTTMSTDSAFFEMRLNAPGHGENYSFSAPILDKLLSNYMNQNFPLIYNDPYSLMYAMPYVITPDASGNNNQLLMEQGLSLKQNVDDYLSYYSQALKYDGIYIVNRRFHNALIASNLGNVPYVVALTISKNLSLRYISRKARYKLSDLINDNNFKNYSVSSDDIYRNEPTIGWDHVPGSFIATPKDLASELPSCIRLIYPRHTFMPTVSTIGLSKYQDVTIGIDQITDPEILASSPFSAVYFNYSTTTEGVSISHNQEHVEITVHGIQWIMNQIRNSDRIHDHHLDAQGNWILNSRYVFGSPEWNYYTDPSQNTSLQYIPSVTVAPGGLLDVNTNFPLGFGGAVLPNKTNFEIAATGIDCDAAPSIVEVQANSHFNIGDYVYPQMSADVIFPNGSQLILSGELKIYNSSRLIIEEGAELVINPGSSIHLDSLASELIIKGKLTVNQNANFAPSGSGVVRMAQSGMTYSNASNYIQLGGNNEFKIIGLDSSCVRLAINETTFLTQAWDSVVVSNCKVLIAGDKYFDIRSTLKALSISIDLDSTQAGSGLHNGFRFYGFNPSVFKSSTVQNGRKGIFVNAIVGTDHNKTITGSKFINNTEGVSARGGSFHFNNCEFVNNDIGLRLKDFANNSTIDHCSFESNSIGVFANSPSRQSLNISSTIFTDNALGIRASEISVHPTCSQWNNNDLSILSEVSSIDLSNDAMCDFANNDTVIRLNMSKELYLKNGRNSFTNNGRIADGDFYFGSGAGNLTTADGITYYLDMKNNNRSGSLSYSMVANIGGVNRTVYFQNTTSVPTVGCNTVVGLEGANKTSMTHQPASNLKVLNAQSTYNSQQLTTGPFAGLAVSSAIESLFVADTIDEVLVVDSLLMILNDMQMLSVMDTITYLQVMGASVKALMPYNTTVSSQLLVNAYDSLEVFASGTTGEHAAIAYHLMSSVNRYNLDFTNAIIHNQNAVNNVSSTDLATQLAYWSCLLPHEKDLFAGIIDFDVYEIQATNCQQTYSFKRSFGYPVIGTGHINSVESDRGIVIYPNPTKDCSVVRPKTLEDLVVVVQTISGVAVKDFVLDSSNDHEYLCIDDLDPGTYVLSVYDAGGRFIESVRWIALN